MQRIMISVTISVLMFVFSLPAQAWSPWRIFGRILDGDNGRGGGLTPEQAYAEYAKMYTAALATTAYNGAIFPKTLFSALFLGGKTISRDETIEICRQQGGIYSDLLTASACVNGRVTVRPSTTFEPLPTQEQNCTRGAGSSYTRVCVFKDASGQYFWDDGPSIDGWADELLFGGANYKVLFWPAGQLHDYCYHHGESTYGTSKAQCDDQFKSFTRALCFEDLKAKAGLQWFNPLDCVAASEAAYQALDKSNQAAVAWRNVSSKVDYNARGVDVGVPLKSPQSFPLSDIGYPDRKWSVDVNGDGNQDLCRAAGAPSGPESQMLCSFSDGTANFTGSTLSPISDWGFPDKRWIADVNNDQKPDYCRGIGEASGPYSFLGCALGTGTGFGKGSQLDFWLPIKDWGYPDRRWLIDFNGDGLADFCRAVGNNSGPSSYLGCSISRLRSNGTIEFITGVTDEFTYLIPMPDWGYPGRRFMKDINGDRKVDFCRGMGNATGDQSYLGCSLSTGSGFKNLPAIVGVTAGNTFLLQVNDWGYEDRRWLMDYDGNGTPDFCRGVGNYSGASSYLGCSMMTWKRVVLSKTEELQVPYFDTTILTAVPDWGVAQLQMDPRSSRLGDEICSFVSGAQTPWALSCANY